MRIALVSEHANPLAVLGGADAGGQNVHVGALAAELAARGHDVTVYSRWTATGVPVRVVTDEGYAVEHVPVGPPEEVPKDDLLQYMPAFARYLEMRWSERPVDIVHAHFWMSGVASTRAARRVDLPVVQTFHALGTVKRRQQGDHDTSPPERLGLERGLCRRVDHVIATCTDEVEELAAMGLPARRATVVPCGVDTDLFRPQEVPPKPHRTLLSIGRLVERKGVGNAIEALAMLPGVELRVAGGPAPSGLHDDPEVRRLREVATRSGVSERVHFLGGVGRERVPELMNEADLVVAVPWYEPFGIVPVEAMACGRPVVGSAVGGLLDTVLPGVTGELVPPRRPDVIALAVRRLLEDPARRVAYGQAGRDRAVALYRWSRVAEATEEVYERIVAAATRKAVAP
ncbi:glycosyltransferase [Humibacillus xanthopallidus]|uniref:Glycosyltransferase involved in cell wall biosynthesis n=1 Tax=Humibacillus xanthopallidus TaxID=412689 RepID=A0A543HHU0_9MICO|nr:glycosyltransferase involved in cell wall biosynthesis [Humibacillus xanthopallidus]